MLNRKRRCADFRKTHFCDDLCDNCALECITGLKKRTEANAARRDEKGYFACRRELNCLMFAYMAKDVGRKVGGRRG